MLHGATFRRGQCLCSAAILPANTLPRPPSADLPAQPLVSSTAQYSRRAGLDGTGLLASANMVRGLSGNETSPRGTWRTVIPVVLALGLVFQAVWLPAHRAFDAHEGDGHAHHDHAPASDSTPDHVRGHPAHGHHANVDHEGPFAERGHDPHEPHHPITDHQPPVAANPGVSAPTLALIEADVQFPERILLARVRARPPPLWQADSPPYSFRSRAPPSA